MRSSGGGDTCRVSLFPASAGDEEDDYEGCARGGASRLRLPATGETGESGGGRLRRSKLIPGRRLHDAARGQKLPESVSEDGVAHAAGTAELAPGDRRGAGGEDLGDVFKARDRGRLPARVAAGGRVDEVQGEGIPGGARLEPETIVAGSGAMFDGEAQAPVHSKRACELVASTRYGRYLTRGPGGRLALDPEAIRAAERLDGKYVLLTNDDTLTPEDVGLGYKSMMIIEACFRRMKTTGLRIRPVYHWTPHRIVSHVKLCALALLVERVAEIRAGDTWRNLRLALDEIKAVRYHVQGTTIVQSTRPTPQAAAILKKLHISPPSRVLAVEKASSAPSTP